MCVLPLEPVDLAGVGVRALPRGSARGERPAPLSAKVILFTHIMVFYYRLLGLD